MFLYFIFENILFLQLIRASETEKHGIIYSSEIRRKKNGRGIEKIYVHINDENIKKFIYKNSDEIYDFYTIENAVVEFISYRNVKDEIFLEQCVFLSKCKHAGNSKVVLLTIKEGKKLTLLRKKYSSILISFYNTCEQFISIISRKETKSLPVSEFFFTTKLFFKMKCYVDFELGIFDFDGGFMILRPLLGDELEGCFLPGLYKKTAYISKLEFNVIYSIFENVNNFRFIIVTKEGFLHYESKKIQNLIRNFMSLRDGVREQYETDSGFPHSDASDNTDFFF